MLCLAFLGSVLASSPELPPDAAAGPATEVVDDVIVVSEPPVPAEEPAEAIEVAPAPTPTITSELEVSVVLRDTPSPRRVIPAPPQSGAGRFVGGAVMFTAGLGLLTAATFEYAGSRDSTRVLIGQVPAGITMLVAGGFMVGTGARDQLRLSTWEARHGVDAKPMGTGLIVGGVSAVTLGSLAAVATSIASDMDLDAPRSIPAGWATAGVALGGGTALLIAGVVRRARYAKWRGRIAGMPMVAPTRAGATVGVVGQF